MLQMQIAAGRQISRNCVEFVIWLIRFGGFWELPGPGICTGIAEE